MISPTSNQAMNYIVEIRNVREVNLFGSADLAFWREHLRREGLFPYDDKGTAELLISATELKWMGVRFHEFSLSVSVCVHTVK